MGAWFSRRKPEDDDDVEEEPEVALTKIDTGDQAAVKNLFDDNVVEYLKDEAKFSFNYKYDNLKMLTMVVAIAFAIGTVWHETPFPEDSNIILVCAGGFFVLNSLLTGYIMFIEKDIIARVFPVKESPEDFFYVRTRVPQYKDHYNLTFESGLHKKKLVKAELYIGTYFDEEGYFDQPAFKKAVAGLVTKYTKAKTE
ncbi:signal peptidase complex subunit 2 [Achlya hypogyna]|uniref:Signal peptidase complex subunit 2 n=1 Tax=Achlya hypogyna TaxID=1202772 RepID=A0A1V9Z746_ACHHY|nr:signal peptidase complex subunit 2 [Achlya hypogyna]